MPDVLTQFGSDIIVFAPMYGSLSLRLNNDYIVNFRGSYYDEISALVDDLRDKGLICFVYEDNGIGRDMKEIFSKVYNDSSSTENIRTLNVAPDGGGLLFFFCPFFFFSLILISCWTVMFLDIISQLADCKSIISVITENNVLSFVNFLRDPIVGDLANATLAFTSFTDPAFLLPQLNGTGISPDNLLFSTVVPPGREDLINHTVSQYFPAHNFSYYAAEGYYAGRLFLAGLYPFLCGV